MFMDPALVYCPRRPTSITHKYLAGHPYNRSLSSGDLQPVVWLVPCVEKLFSYRITIPNCYGKLVLACELLLTWYARRD